ncbi:MAG: SpoIID/LytB domain-containing protein [Candidatus Omnitrophica bacterium]|nr:SpoIID/LytB domain-containing protein [Candidatus Omnitrophota bacterium]
MTIKKISYILIGILLAISILKFFFVLPGRVGGERGVIVRVRIAHNADSAIIASNGPCKLVDVVRGKILDDKLDIHDGVTARAPRRGIALEGHLYELDRIRIYPYRNKGIRVDNVVYRGNIEIIRNEERMDIINRVDIEDYLKGVVPREMNSFWPFAALKAQAIASRSFTVYETIRRKNREFDVTNDTFSQVYGGRSAERWRTSGAVDATRGQVLARDGVVFPAYFHSCCGGHTQDSSRVWGKRMALLEGVKCRWCRWSPHFRWQAKIPTATILEGLKARGYDVDRIDDIKIGPRDDSGRVVSIRIRSWNRWLEIGGDDLRSAVGRKYLKSLNMNIKKYPRFYLFSGYGWGHGVGMCQWGALKLAFDRWGAEKILKFYYPNTEITRFDKVRRIFAGKV